MGQGARLVAVGLLVGAGIAVATTRLIGSLLVDTSPTDLWTFIGASVVLTTVAMCACYLPARRAALIEPSVVLRESEGAP